MLPPGGISLAPLVGCLGDDGVLPPAWPSLAAGTTMLRHSIGATAMFKTHQHRYSRTNILGLYLDLPFIMSPTFAFDFPLIVFPKLPILAQ